MTKRQTIDEILTINRTADPGFLAQFQNEDLGEYLEHLHQVFGASSPSAGQGVRRAAEATTRARAGRWLRAKDERLAEEIEQRAGRFGSPLAVALTERDDVPLERSDAISDTDLHDDGAPGQAIKTSVPTALHRAVNRLQALEEGRSWSA